MQGICIYALHCLLQFPLGHGLTVVCSQSLLAWKDSQRKGNKGGKHGNASGKSRPGAKVTDAEGKQSEEESATDADVSLYNLEAG